MVDRAVAAAPTVLTGDGGKEAVLVSFDEWERLSQMPSFADLLLAFPVNWTTSPNDYASTRASIAVSATSDFASEIENDFT